MLTIFLNLRLQNNKFENQFKIEKFSFDLLNGAISKNGAHKLSRWLICIEK